MRNGLKFFLDVLYSSLGMYSIWKLQRLPDFVFGQQGRRHPKHMGCLKGLCDVSTLRQAAPKKNCPNAKKRDFLPKNSESIKSGRKKGCI